MGANSELMILSAYVLRLDFTYNYASNKMKSTTHKGS